MEKPGTELRAIKIRAPWTLQQVIDLNRYQENNYFHPYTCGVDSSHGRGRLIATEDGWVCPDCSYRQDWVHSMTLLMVDMGP